MVANDFFVSFKDYSTRFSQQHHLQNRTHEFFSHAENNAHLLRLQERLDNIGFRKLRFFRSGSNALTFCGTENQIVRISINTQSESHHRPKEPFILQPIYSESIKLNTASGERALLIEVLPELDPHVSWEDRALIRKTLRKSGYEAEDYFIHGNVGLINVDGKKAPVLIDCGALKRRDGAKRHTTEEKKTICKLWLDEDGGWLQKKFEPRTRPSNVINGKEAQCIEAVMKKIRRHKDDGDSISHQVTAAVVEDGLYADEIAMLHKNAHAAYLNSEDPQKSFACYLKQERANMEAARHSRT